MRQTGTTWWIGLLIFAFAGCAAMPVKPPAEMAAEAWEQGQWTRARHLLEKALRQQPENLDARYNLAWLLEREGHEDAAAALYQKNLQYRMHLPSAINLALHYYQKHERQRAIAILQQAAKALPFEAAPRYLLAQWLHEAGDERAAERLFRAAVQADPDNALAHLFYARWLAASGQSEAALRESARAVALQPECAACWRIHGDIQMQFRLARQAVASYQRSLAIRPDIDTRMRLIAALEAAGETERALRMREALQAWLKHHPAPQTGAMR